MKKNVMLLSCAALLALALAGCSQSTAQADYIGTDAAKAIALEAAGIGEADATFTTAELEHRDNTAYYEVDFTARRDEEVEFFQVASPLGDESSIKREERPLRFLKDIGRKTILTLDRELPDDADGIRYVNLVDWLEDADVETRGRVQE